jgi:hypothetical protein
VSAASVDGEEEGVNSTMSDVRGGMRLESHAKQMPLGEDFEWHFFWDERV